MTCLGCKKKIRCWQKSWIYKFEIHEEWRTFHSDCYAAFSVGHTEGFALGVESTTETVKGE